MFYRSGNQDESVFNTPRPSTSPAKNNHIGFGGAARTSA